MKKVLSLTLLLTLAVFPYACNDNRQAQEEAGSSEDRSSYTENGKDVKVQQVRDIHAGREMGGGGGNR